MCRSRILNFTQIEQYMWKLCDAIHLRPAAKYNRQSADFHGSGTCLTTRQQRDSP